MDIDDVLVCLSQIDKTNLHKTIHFEKRVNQRKDNRDFLIFPDHYISISKTIYINVVYSEYIKKSHRKDGKVKQRWFRHFRVEMQAQRETVFFDKTSNNEIQKAATLSEIKRKIEECRRMSEYI